jgi:hypothetical protein
LFVKAPPLEPGPSLAAVASNEEPPVDLDPFLARLRNAGITEFYLATETPSGAVVEVGTSEALARDPAVIMAKGRRFSASQPIDWQASDTPVRDTLDQLVVLVQKFDKITRFRLAASDMRTAAHAARALVAARENNGPARLFDRVIETGMVVTYGRPYLESNEAGIGRDWWPKDEADRDLHDEVLDLRDEYHAHASHTPRRRLENTSELLSLTGRSTGRPRFAESFERLPTRKLRTIEDLATRQADRFDVEAERLDVELFGPIDE